jgi:hypothetical protein
MNKTTEFIGKIAIPLLAVKGYCFVDISNDFLFFFRRLKMEKKNGLH